ncbi:hypothetical protein [Nocardia cyriacigeorgica]|uniref:hypothetical protein n=1 Tax=Nocardia cyriacigeorgica TaxID=135487 RepID=UPI002458DE45|nr:hypothetical protein [Nocardia cyriacigeorgica]
MSIRTTCLPAWWFTTSAGYIVVFVMLTSVAVVLIAAGIAPLSAVGVPLLLSSGATAAVRRMWLLSTPSGSLATMRRI